MVTSERALPGRREAMLITQRTIFGMGSFRSAERMFWSLPGVRPV
jgi:hypothetical protein